MRVKETLSAKFFKKRIEKISPALADKERINSIVMKNTAGLTPNLEKLIQQRLADTFKSIQKEYMESNPEVAQYIRKEMKE